jgi:hypothetical protein
MLPNITAVTPERFFPEMVTSGPELELGLTLLTIGTSEAIGATVTSRVRTTRPPFESTDVTVIVYLPALPTAGMPASVAARPSPLFMKINPVGSVPDQVKFAVVPRRPVPIGTLKSPKVPSRNIGCRILDSTVEDVVKVGPLPAATAEPDTSRASATSPAVNAEQCDRFMIFPPLPSS